MGNLLSPLMANIFTEKFEEDALATPTNRPTYWYRYIDDTFVIWPHGKDTLHGFLDHLNSRNSNIRFTMDV